MRVEDAARINREAGDWVVTLPPPDVIVLDDEEGGEELREARRQWRDRLGRWVDMPDLRGHWEKALGELPASTHDAFVAVLEMPGVRRIGTLKGVMFDGYQVFLGNEFLGASPKERKRMLANPVPPPEGDPLELDTLDTLLAEWLEPEDLDAPRVPHPKSGFPVKRGLERRVTRPPEGESEAPLEFTVTRHGEALFPEKVGTEPVKFVYRGVSEEEWQQALERGHVQSDGRGVIAEWEGTNAGLEPRTGVSYLPYDAPGRIIKIRVEEEDEWFAIPHDSYARSRKPIPLDRVVAKTPLLKKDSEFGMRLLEPLREAPKRKLREGARRQWRNRLGQWVDMPDLLDPVTAERRRYPRTPHLPWSPGGTNDDTRLDSIKHLEGRRVVVTEKMDGENTTLSRDFVHARSPDSQARRWQTRVRAWHAQIAHELPPGWRFLGENLQAAHSIEYDGVPHFMLFGVVDERGRSLAWDDVVDWAGLLGVPTPPVLYDGVFDERALRGIDVEGSASAYGPEMEGYVLRVADAFPEEEFDQHFAKYVRPDHVQTDRHWTRNWKENRLSEASLRPWARQWRNRLGEWIDMPDFDLPSPRDGKGRVELFARRVVDVVGVDPYDVDLEKLDAHCRAHERDPQTRVPGPGSPCFNSRHVDYAVHVWLPGVIQEKYPKMAKRLLRTSPRWGHRGDVLPPPVNVLAEAPWREVDHPRNRLGRFIEKLGLPAFEVGGAVRDPLLGKEPKDVDYMVMASPERIAAAVEATGNVAEPLVVRDRLVGVRAHGRDLPPGGVELAPPRVEVSTGEGRHDFQIEPHPAVTSDEGVDREAVVGDDARRRDFTVNALYKDTATGEVVDPTGRGLEDAEGRTLSVIGDDSFQEDPLRILRGVRFVSQHGLEPDERTRELMERDAPQITALTRGGVSGTVRTELEKTLMGDHVGRALRLARDTGTLAQVLPELAPSIGFDQESRYHDLPLDEHLISAVEQAAEAGANLRTRLALLLHDSGKPEMAWRGEDGRLHYYANPDEGREDHAVVGARIADEALRRLGFPGEMRRDVVKLIANHMLPEAQSKRPIKARRLRQRMGDDALVADLILHRRMDGRAKGEELVEEGGSHEQELDRLAALLDDVAADPVAVGDLAINGTDLIAAGVPQGPMIGAILRQLLEEVMANPSLNNPSWLLGRVQALVRKDLREGRVDVRRQWRDRRGRWIEMPDVPGLLRNLVRAPGARSLELPPVPEQPGRVRALIDGVAEQMVAERRAVIRERMGAGASPLPPEGMDRLYEEALLGEGFRKVAASRQGRRSAAYAHPSGGRLSVRTDATGNVEDSAWEPGGTAEPPRRLETAPASWQEWADDVMAFTEEMGDRHNVDVLARSFTVDESMMDTAGLHTWEGDIQIGPDARRDVEWWAKEGLEPGRYFHATKVAIHEGVHAVNPTDYVAYQFQDGRALEEALTEEVALREVVRRLDERGEREPLQWAFDRPMHDRTAGTYEDERHALTYLLNAAYVPPEMRREVLEEMAFRMDHATRVEFLTAAVGQAQNLEPDDARAFVADALNEPHVSMASWSSSAADWPEDFAAGPGPLADLPLNSMVRIPVRSVDPDAQEYRDGVVMNVEPLDDGSGKWLLSIGTERGPILLRRHEDDLPEVISRGDVAELEDGDVRAGDLVEYDRHDGGVSRAVVRRVIMPGSRERGEDFVIEAVATDESLAPGEPLVLAPDRVHVRRVERGVQSPPVERREAPEPSGYDTGVFFHVTSSEAAGAIRQGGYVDPRPADAEGTFGFPVDPDAVYLWPSREAAEKWIEYRRGRGHTDALEVVPVHADTAMLEPDPEPLEQVMALADRESDPWPGFGVLDDARHFPDPVNQPEGQTLREWVRETGWRPWYADATPSTPTPDDVRVDPWVRSRAALAAMPVALRRDVARAFAERDLALVTRGSRPVVADDPPDTALFGMESPGRTPAMNARQLSSLLQSHGFRQVRQRGSHRVFQPPGGGRNVIVPDHGSRALARGTLMNALRTAGVASPGLRADLIERQRRGEALARLRPEYEAMVRRRRQAPTADLQVVPTGLGDLPQVGPEDGLRGALEFMAERNGFRSVEGYETDLAARLRLLTHPARAHVAVRVPEALMPAVLEKGGLVNALDPSHRPDDPKRPSYVEHRREWESRVWSIDSDDPADHPVYGYLAEADEALTGSAPRAFGEVKLILADHVRDRTTFTYSDSNYQGAGDGRVMPSPVNDPRPEAVPYRADLKGVRRLTSKHGAEPREVPLPPEVSAKLRELGMTREEVASVGRGLGEAPSARHRWEAQRLDADIRRIEDEAKAAGFTRWDHGDFFEAQVHGGVRVDEDVAGVQFERDPSPEVHERLRALGLPWAVYPEVPVLRRPRGAESPVLTEPMAEVALSGVFDSPIGRVESVVEEVYRDEWDGETVVVGALYHDGVEVGEWGRIADGDTITHSSFEVADAVQGKGVGRAFFDFQMKRYREVGFRHVTVATTDVGTYAWARMGFDTDALDWARWRQRLRQTHRGGVFRPRLEGTPLSGREDEIAAELDAWLDQRRSMAEVARWGYDEYRWEDEDGREMWPGKALLLDVDTTGWSGALRVPQEGAASPELESRATRRVARRAQRFPALAVPPDRLDGEEGDSEFWAGESPSDGAASPALQSREAAAEERARELFSTQVEVPGQPPVLMVVNEAIPVETGDGEGVVVEGELVSTAGEIGSFSRTWVGDTVFHEEFSIDRRYQRRGVGRAVFDHMIDRYRQAGVSEVRVTAMGVGGYAWARMGFERMPGEWERFADRLVRVVDKWAYEQEVSDLEAAVLEFREWLVEPRPMIEVAGWGRERYRDGEGMWPGKRALLRTGWDGVLRLDALEEALTAADAATVAAQLPGLAVPPDDDLDHDDEEFWRMLGAR